jgi:hypothetical protein
MKLLTISPFRIPLYLDKDNIKSRSKEWNTYLNILEDKINNSKKIKINVYHGNYCCIVRNGQLVYGDSATNSKNIFSEKYYVLRFSKEFSEGSVRKQYACDQIQLSLKTFDIRVMDNACAIASLEFDIPFEVFYNLNGDGINKLIDSTNKITQCAINDHKDILNAVIREFRYIDASLQGLFVLSNTNKTIFFDDHIYQNYMIPWVNRTYVLTTKESNLFTSENDNVLKKLLPSNDIDEWCRHKKSIFGWGGNIEILSDEMTNFHNTLIIAQFFYFSFDVIDQVLPILISQYRTGERLSPIDSLATSRNLGYESKFILGQFNDLIIRVTGEPKNILASIYKAWNIESLTSSINRKIDLFENVSAELSDLIDKKSNNLIRAILFIIGLFSIISLSTNLQGYLAPNDNNFMFKSFRLYMQHTYKDEVLLFSIIIIFLVSFAYLILKRK